MLFNLLKALDLNPSAKKIKLSHLEFLIWYIFRLSLNYLPFHEVGLAVRKILFGGENYVVSATIVNMDDKCSTPSLNVAELFRIWFLAAYRRTGDLCIILGSNGQLTFLKDALEFWIGEHMGENFRLTRNNELRLVMSIRDRLVRWEFKFDDQMRLMLPYGDSEMKYEGKHVILADDSESLIDFEDFSRVIRDYPIIGDIMNRMHNIGSAAWNMDLSMSDNQRPSDAGIKVKCSFLLDSTSDKKEILLGRAEVSTSPASDPNIEAGATQIEKLISASSSLIYSKVSVPLAFVKIERLKYKSIKSIIMQALSKLKIELVSAAKDVHYGSAFKYKEESLELLKVTLTSAKVLVTIEEKTKSVKTLEVTADEAYSLLGMNRTEGSSSKPEQLTKILDLKIVFDKKQLRSLYSHYTRDFYALGGIAMATDQLVPCQVNQVNNLFSDVLYEHNTGTR